MKISGINSNQNLNETFNYPKSSTDTKCNEYDNSNFISKLLFNWTLPIVKYSRTNQIKIAHLGEISENQNTQAFNERIKIIWYGKNYKNCKRIPLMLLVLRANIGTILYFLFLSFICMVLDILVLLFFKDYLNLFQSKKVNELETRVYFELSTYQLGSCILVAKLLFILITKQNNFSQMLFGFKACIQVQSLIFDKLLKISHSSKSKYTEGEITNFIQIDAKQISDMLRFL
jgi:hypothetical protein